MGSRSIIVRFFGAYLARKDQFPDFSQNIGYKFWLVSTISFEMLIFLNLLMKYDWVVVGAVFFSVSFYKKLNFRYRFDIPPCALRFSNLTLIFYQSIGRIRLHTDKLHWHGRNWLRPKFPLGERFLQRSFWRKQLKTQFFQRASVFVAILWPNIPWMAFQGVLLLWFEAFGRKIAWILKEEPLKGPVLMNSSMICLLKELKWKLEGFITLSEPYVPLLCHSTVT